MYLKLTVKVSSNLLINLKYHLYFWPKKCEELQKIPNINIKKVKEEMLDWVIPVLEESAHWTEFIMKHKGAPTIWYKKAGICTGFSIGVLCNFSCFSFVNYCYCSNNQ